MDDKRLNDLAALFKIFSNSTRIKILACLIDGQKAVNEIASQSHMSISAVSHQLKILQENDLVKSQRYGKNIYYSLSDNHVQTILEMGSKHIEEQ